MKLGSRKLLPSEWLQENEISSSVFLLRALAGGQIGTGGQALVSKPGRHQGARLGLLHPALLSSCGRCQTGGVAFGSLNHCKCRPEGLQSWRCILSLGEWSALWTVPLQGKGHRIATESTCLADYESLIIDSGGSDSQMWHRSWVH